MNQSLSCHIGRRLRARRRLLGLTLAELGERCGASFQLIHKYEAGIVQISAASLFQVANALEVPCDYFFDGLGNGFGRSPRRRDEGARPAA